MCIWSNEERKKLLRKNDLFIKSNESSPEIFKAGILKNKRSNNFITNLQYLDMQTYMVDDILTKVDRASMLNSLEVRVPILDHKFAELTFKIPSDLKLKGKDGKHILKTAMSKVLPENILKHPKQGFAVPLSLWFKDDLREYVNDTVLSSNALLSSYVDKNYVKKIIEGNKSGMRDFSAKIWSLVFFEEWLKQTRI